MSSEILEFRKYLRGVGGDGAPNVSDVLRWVENHPSIMEVADPTLGGLLNNIISSKHSVSDKLIMIRSLVEKGVSASGVAGSRSPLSHAIHEGLFEVSTYLIARSKLPRRWEGDDDPLVAAIVVGDLGTVKMLDACGMDVGAAKNGASFLSLAKRWSRDDIADFIREAAGVGSGKEKEAEARHRLETPLGAVRDVVSHVLYAVSVSITDRALYTDSLGGKSREGEPAELFMEVEQGEDLKAWPLQLIFAGVSKLLEGDSEPTDLGELVEIPSDADTSYSHLLLLADFVLGGRRYFRMSPLYPKEAEEVSKSRAIALLQRFEEMGVPGRVRRSRRPVF